MTAGKRWLPVALVIGGMLALSVIGVAIHSAIPADGWWRELAQHERDGCLAVLIVSLWFRRVATPRDRAQSGEPGS